MQYFIQTLETNFMNKETLQTNEPFYWYSCLHVFQIEESIKYTCIGDTCEKSELYDVLQEMDRRYYLIQDFRWEFSLLDEQKVNTISEEKAK